MPEQTPTGTVDPISCVYGISLPGEQLHHSMYYIGATPDLKRRIQEHLSKGWNADMESDQTPELYKWMHEHLHHGICPLFLIQELCSAETLWKREKSWIYFYHKHGEATFNRNNFYPHGNTFVETKVQIQRELLDEYADCSAVLGIPVEDLLTQALEAYVPLVQRLVEAAFEIGVTPPYNQLNKLNLPLPIKVKVGIDRKTTFEVQVYGAGH